MAGVFEKVMDARHAIVQDMIAMMEKGFFHNRDEWDRAALRPGNPISGVWYKGGNRLRLMMAVMKHRYTDPRWATARQFNEKGYYIKKGEHGIPCEKWIFTKNERSVDEHGNTVYKEVELEHPQVSYFTVFNAQQVDGMPPFEKMQEQVAQTDLTILGNQLLDVSECPVHMLAQERAFYSPAMDQIILPLRSMFKDEESFIKTYLHESSHASGHPSRLNRDLSGTFGSESYAREELRAELGALFTEIDLGLSLKAEHYEDHSDYFKSWIGALDKDVNELFRACADAQKISERLIGNYTRKYELKQERTLDAIPEKEETQDRNKESRIQENRRPARSR